MSQMTCVQDVQRAGSPHEALLAIAKHIDELKQPKPADPWASWGSDSAPPSPPTAAVAPATPTDHSAEIARINQALGYADGEDAQALHARLRLLEDEGAAIDLSVPAGQRETVTVSDTDITVELPPPSAERMAARAAWARDRRLHEFITTLTQDEIVTTYAKGGPLWLYHGDRDAVMQMPLQWRREMVDDLMLDSPATAQEIGRDILKYTTEEAEARARTIADEKPAHA